MKLYIHIYIYKFLFFISFDVKQNIQKLTSFFLLKFGLPQGSSPPGKLGMLRQTIDLMLQIKKKQLEILLMFIQMRTKC